MTSVKNHFVPQVLLKQWSMNNKIFIYKKILPYEPKNIWQGPKTIQQIAYRRLLYWSGDDYSLEHLFNEKMENYIPQLLQKIKQNKDVKDLNNDDKEILYKMILFQYIRTPVFANVSIKNAEQAAKNYMNNEKKKLENAVIKLENIKNAKKESDFFKMTYEVLDEQMLLITFEIVNLKKFWIGYVKTLFLEKYKLLALNNWYVIEAPEGCRFYFSDSPVIIVDCESERNCISRGGLIKENNIILMPITPNLLLFSKVGYRGPVKRKMNESEFNLCQQLIIKNAYNEVYSPIPCCEISKFHNRIINKDSDAEIAKWNKQIGTKNIKPTNPLICNVKLKYEK